jgi:hypothetical protein
MEFLKANAGKLGVVVVLLAAAIVFLSFRGGGKPSRSAKSQFVCVATGETFWLKRKPRIPPVENPDTGQRTLVPCHENEDGTTSVSSRVRSVVTQLDREGVNKYVDPETLTIRATP